ncbi:MAG: hypothetical protein ABW360_01210 [Phenylobacterium sp.]
MRRLWMAAVAAASIAGPAAAQTFDAAVQAARSLEHKGIAPFAGVSTYGALNRHWTVTTFYVAWEGRGPARRASYLARQAVGGLGGQQSVAWADGAACPALIDRLGEMTRLRAPGVQVPGLGGPRDLNVVMDGTSYRLWARWGAYPDTNASGDVEMSGNVDTPLAAWTDATVAALQPCWRPG